MKVFIKQKRDANGQEICGNVRYRATARHRVAILQHHGVPTSNRTQLDFSGIGRVATYSTAGNVNSSPE
jgi:hypothetical protein